MNLAKTAGILWAERQVAIDGFISIGFLRWIYRRNGMTDEKLLKDMRLTRTLLCPQIGTFVVDVTRKSYPPFDIIPTISLIKGCKMGSTSRTKKTINPPPKFFVELADKAIKEYRRIRV